MDAGLFPVDPHATGFGAQPEGFLSALALGARRVVRFWPVLLLMLLGTLLSAGLLALIPALNLFGLAHRPVIDEMASGIRAWQLVDLIGIISGSLTTNGGNPIFSSLAIVLLGFAAMPLVGGIASAFLYGGVLVTYKVTQPGSRLGGELVDGNETPPKFRLRDFLCGCWHWFGAFLALGIIQALLFVGMCFLLITLVIFLARLGPPGIAASVAIVLLAAWLWLMVFELARVRLVLNDTRNPFRGLWLSIGDLFHRPLPLLAFYAAALLLLLVVQAVFRLGINPRVPLEALIPALIVQQGFILVRLFCQALRLAGLMEMLKK
jgi:hypothetical protein